MTRLDLLTAGLSRAVDVRSTGHTETADPDGKGGAFDALLKDLARPATKGRIGGSSDDDVERSTSGRSARQADRTRPDPADEAATPSDAVAAEAGLDAARLLLSGLAAERSPQHPSEPGADADVPASRQDASTVDQAGSSDRQPRTLAATVVARETHFEPVRRPASLDSAFADPGTNTPEAAPHPDDAGAAVGAGGLNGLAARTDDARSAPLVDGRPRGTSIADAPAEPPADNLSASADEASLRLADPEERPTTVAPRAVAPPQPTAGEARPADLQAGHADPDAAADATPRAPSTASNGGTSAESDGDAPSSERRAAMSAAPASAVGTAEPTEAALPPATLQRLAGAILAEARSTTTAAPSQAAASGETATTGGPVKILTLRLQPESLGTVTVRLRLVGNALEMQIRAGSSDTAELLKRDRQALEEILKSSGYDTDLLTIQSAGDGPRIDTATTVPSAGRQDAPTDGGFRQGGGGQPSGRETSDGDRPRSQPATTQKAEMHDEAPRGGDRPGGIYL